MIHCFLRKPSHAPPELNTHTLNYANGSPTSNVIGDRITNADARLLFIQSTNSMLLFIQSTQSMLSWSKSKRAHLCLTI